VLYCGDRCPGNANLTFKCEGSIFCVPMEIVCDSRVDCPDGSDEKYCHGLYKNFNSDGYAQVMKKTMGMWHTKCYPMSTPPTQKDVEDMCKQLGLKSEKPSAVVRGHNIQKLSEDNGENIKFLPVELHTENATKTILFSKFAPIKISDSFTVHLKTDKPLAKVVSWDKSDEENCLRLEIKCT
jgi:Low-density lipoprotein receptor domain class A